MKVVVVNYGLGNLRSVEKAIKRVGFNCEITSDHMSIASADKLILPGVGAFGEGMSKLKQLDLVSVLNEQVLNNNKPILGICLGMQLMCKHSEEGNVDGLNWIDAGVKKFKIDLKVPHIGWNTVSVDQRNNVTTAAQTDNEEFYFTHSYFVECSNAEDVMLTSNYGVSFVSGFAKGNIYGVQFHPEKSHSAGLSLIKEFLKS